MGTRVAPGGDVLGIDRTLDGWIADHLTTAVHLCGTAAIGRVVDAELRVLGIDGLRVADTSVLPAVPRRGTAATAVAIGEKAADLLARMDPSPRGPTMPNRSASTASSSSADSVRSGRPVSLNTPLSSAIRPLSTTSDGDPVPPEVRGRDRAPGSGSAAGTRRTRAGSA